MTRQGLKIVQNFHCFLFSQALRESVKFKPTGSDGSSDGYFVVLMKPNGYDVDYDSMRHALTRQTSLRPLTGETCKIDVDMVVSKNYMESRQKFAVLNVSHDRSPMSPFPDKSKAKTFEGYFWGKYGKSFRTMKQPLIEVKDISGRVNFLVDRKVAAKSKRDVIELFPELCNVFPISASLLSVSLMLPSILHRVNALLLVDDVKEMVDGVRDNTDESSLPSIGSGNANDGKSLLRTDKDSFSSKKNVGRKDYSDDSDDDVDDFPELFSDLKSLFSGNRRAAVHPNSAFVLKALTTTHSGDAFNLERLEMLGDAFLKLAVSLHLYCTYHDKDEGKLTLRKVRQISNLALFRGAERTSLAGFQQSTQLARDVWCPTGCQQSTAESGVTAMEVDEVRTKMEVDDADSAEHQGLGSGRDKCNTQVIADKSVADSMEALIGAYLICCGYTGALRFMKFLGLKVLPEDDDIDEDIGELAEKSREGCYARFWPEQANTSGAYQSQDMVSRMVSGLENFEKNSIKYTFNSKLYLVEALTHASYQANRITPCYQRLEFLGDALLDFLVTQHLYFRHEKLSPGELTDIRQALVNNNIFAAIAVKYEYNKYLRQMSPKWFKSIENFITRLDDEKEENVGIADPFIIISTQDKEGIEAPKVLGDIFESVAGAVFLDSGMDLTKVWGVYYRMMQPYIDHYSVNIPINPIRRVYELDNEREFSKAEALADGRVKRTLRVSWGKFDGYGKNSKIARATAAKLAVKALDRRDSPGTIPLAIQQARVIKKHTDLKVKHYVGEMGVDFWDKDKWENEFNENNVLVMTAQIFLNLLLHGFIKLSQVNLLIFDECHHAKKSHPYKQIMNRFVGCQETDYPKIMGLTASVVNKKVKPGKIESEIQELECTLRSTCETSQDEDVGKFASKPNEQIIQFSNANFDDSTIILLQKLQEVLRPGMNYLRDYEVQGDGPSWDAQSFALSALTECQEILSEMGPWAANKIAGYLIKDLQVFIDRVCMFQDCKEGRMFCEFSKTQLQQLQGVYNNYTSTLGSGETDSTEKLYVMPKVKELLSVLKKEYGNAQNSENKLCGIVFVERRCTALVLSEQINIAAKSDHELSFIESSFVIGHGTGGKANYSNEAEMNFKKQEEVLRQFRLHEFNLLIATSVVEEGLDIPKCNLVCRFDFPMTLRSYVQSKGRARAKDSNYIILVDEEEYEEKQGELEMMREIENCLSKKCHGRKEPSKEECEEVAGADSFLPPYEPENRTGAIVTMENSVSLLSMYCSMLPSDRFTHLSPVYKIEEVEEDGKMYLSVN
ncbi:unnamed protein product [Porites lobata]|uniref:Uncharacterized protein n=1 Tax=Porites lobata TaxID=104759 RepID=A0ABN8N110_9CNID|nr:unnamed protein product [Porites lobata]